MASAVVLSTLRPLSQEIGDSSLLPQSRIELNLCNQTEYWCTIQSMVIKLFVVKVD